jgi:hypothetical protein
MKLFLGVLLTLFAHIIGWFQLNGQFLWPWFKNHKVVIALIFSFPVSILFIYAQDFLYQSLGQKIWSARLTSFGLSITSFYILSTLVMDEEISLKTGVCLGLSFLIIILQIFWHE